jgi:3-dehydroquinate synthase
METVVVTPGGSDKRAYSVHVGAGLVEKTSEWASSVEASQAFIIADARLAKNAQKLSQALTKAKWKVDRALVKVSESAKDYRKIFPLYTKLIEKNMDRHSVLFALGGGVIGDLTGFIAGSYLRGMRWVGVPSTLLAQVDSSIGGKTGVNHPLGKNLIGLFHQPSLVLCDTDLLQTLSLRDRVSGFAEMVKVSLTFDKAFYEFLVQHHQSILQLEPKYLDVAVVETIRQKADVVCQDEFERTGLRQILNFGHTMGHALESATEYRHFRHGEAVLLGMRLEMALSVIRGHLPHTKYQAVDDFLKTLPIPKIPKGLTPKKLVTGTKHDKKVKDGKVNYVLLEDIGKAVVDNQVSDSDVTQAWKMMIASENTL